MAIHLGIERVVEALRVKFGDRVASIAVAGSAPTATAPRDIDLVVIIEDDDLSWADLRREAVALHLLEHDQDVGSPVSIRLFGRSKLPEAARSDGFRIQGMKLDACTLAGDDLLADARPELTEASLLTSFAVNHLYWLFLAEDRGYAVALSQAKLAERVNVNAAMLGESPDHLRTWFASTPAGSAIRKGILYRDRAQLASVAESTLAGAKHEWTHRGDDYSSAIKTLNLSNLDRRVPPGWM
jgi:hypothetical protein